MRSWEGAALAVLLGGCVAYHARPIAPERTADEYESRSLAAPELRRFIESQEGRSSAEWPPAAWTLDDLAFAALYFQPDLDVARAHWSVARAGRKTASEIPNPTLNVGPFQWVSNEIVPGTPVWIGALALDVPIETAGKRRLRTLRAEALAAQARVDLAQSAWSVRSRLRAAALELWAAQESEAVLRHQQDELAKNERLLVDRARRGETSSFNAFQATLLADRSRLALEDGRRRRVEAAAGLAAAIGVPFRAIQEISLSSAAFSALPDPADPSLEQARRQATTGRTDLLGLLAAYAVSEADVRLEVALQYPDVHLAPGFEYDQGADKWGIGFSLPVPLFNRHRGAIAEAEARRREAAARFLQLQASVIDQIDRARASYPVSYGKLKAADAALARHLEQDKALREILRPGDVSRLTLFRSQLDIDTTRLARVQAAFEAQQALGLLEDALERPLSGATLPAAAYESDPRAGGRR